MSMTMSKGPDEPFRRVEVITSVQRRWRWSVAKKMRLVEEAMQPRWGGLGGRVDAFGFIKSQQPRAFSEQPSAAERMGLASGVAAGLDRSVETDAPPWS